MCLLLFQVGVRLCYFSLLVYTVLVLGSLERSAWMLSSVAWVEISSVCRVEMLCCLRLFVMVSDILELAFVVCIVGVVILCMHPVSVCFFS